MQWEFCHILWLGVFRKGYPGGEGRQLLWQGERTTQTGTGDQVPLATRPGLDHEAGTEPRHSAGRQSDSDVGVSARESNEPGQHDPHGETGSGAGEKTAEGTILPELKSQLDALQRDFADLQAANRLNPETEAELTRIAEDDAKATDVLGMGIVRRRAHG